MKPLGVLGLIGVVIICGSMANGGQSMFSSGEHCVAYRAKNKMALFIKVNVIGKNCDISTQIVPDLNGTYYFEMRIPVASFNSDETKRDEDVAKILKGKTHPNLNFRTSSLTLADWGLLFEKKSFQVKGSLAIGDRVTEVKAQVTMNRKKGKSLEVDGVISTTFGHFNLKPPTFVGGFGAQVQKELELHFHVLSEKTLGANELLGQGDGFSFEFSQKAQTKKQKGRKK